MNGEIEMNQPAPAPKKIERPAGPLADPPAATQPSLETLAIVPSPEESARAPRRRDPETGRLLPTQQGDADPEQAGGTAAALPQRDDGSEMPRRQRRRWGERRYTLPRHNRPGFKPHVFNDTPGRIEEARERGYSHVLDRDGKPISVVVDREFGVKGFLMEIPEEFYNQDFADKQAKADEIDDAMLRKVDSDGGYRPVDQATGRPLTSVHVTQGRRG